MVFLGSDNYKDLIHITHRHKVDSRLFCNTCAISIITVSGVALNMITEKISIATVQAMTKTLTTEILCLMRVAGATASA